MEEEENNDELIYPIVRPHAASPCEEAPTSPTADVEEGWEVKESVEDDDGQESEICLCSFSETEMEDVSEDYTYYDEEKESIEEEESAKAEEYFQSYGKTLTWSSIRHV